MAITITDLYRILFGRSKLYGGDVISMSEHGRTGGINTGQPFKFISYTDETVKITEDGSDTYIGLANIGTAEATAAWKCLKITESGSDTIITWADGDVDYDNVATDLTALSYS